MGDAAPDLIVEVRDRVAWIVFNRPAARNAFTLSMYDALRATIEGLPEDGSVRAVVLAGAGDKAFAAGTDIAEFRAFDGPDDAIRYEARIDDTLTAIERCPLPTIAAIAGACTGGGAGIAAACDLRIAAVGARFGFPIARTLGNCLSMANLARLTALIGAGRVKEILFTARLVPAEEALAAGLVGEVLPNHAALMARAAELAAIVAGHAPLTLWATKEGLRRLREGRRDDADIVTACYTSADFREGLEAFLAKRPARWSGR